MANLKEGITLEEVENVLTEIENKYRPVIKKSSSTRDFPHDKLYVLSKEFDTFGLPTVDLTQSSSKIFQDVVHNAHALVQKHRKTLVLTKDLELNSQNKRAINANLVDKIEDYKKKIQNMEHKYYSLQNKLIKSNNEVTDLKKREALYKEEIDKLKKYHKTKLNELTHHINRLTFDNNHLHKIFGKDIGTYVSKDDITVQLLNKYKTNEDIYKSSIQKLEENNKQLIQEVLDLKQELAIIDDNNTPSNK